MPLQKVAGRRMRFNVGYRILNASDVSDHYIDGTYLLILIATDAPQKKTKHSGTVATHTSQDTSEYDASAPSIRTCTLSAAC